jgi:Zn-dependent membrane protease YugP
MFGLDMTYYFFLIPGMVLAGIAAMLTKSTFKKYSKQAASTGLTGAQAAQRLLDHEGIRDVSIEAVRGFLSDHYDPTSKTLRLSPEVYGARSMSAIGVACHEVGHAIQHARSYAPLALRSALVPAANIGNKLSMFFLMGGVFLGMTGLIKVGVILFSAAVAFSIITLPVEWDASARAKRLMVTSSIVAPQELTYASRVLNAAFLTYVAAALTAILQLLYFILRARE